MTNIEADVVVIGSGAGGGFAATALAEAGWRVVLLERGPWFQPKDFPTRHADWERRPAPFAAGNPAMDPSITWTPGAPIDPTYRHLCSRAMDGPPPANERRGRFRYERAFGVGGTTLQYQGEAHRFSPHAFQPQTLFDLGRDWPFGYEDLEPYYETAEAWLGVAGDPDHPFKPKRGPFFGPAHPLSTKSQWAQRGARKLHWTLFPNALALPSKSHQGRMPCRYAGVCAKGCPFGAKSSVDLAVLPRGLSTGKLSVIDQARVTRLNHGADGQVDSATYLKGGHVHEARATVFILAAGALESPRLLLGSTSAAFPMGLGNHHDQVGRHLMETILTAVTVETEEPVAGWKGPPIDARLWDFSRPGPGDRHGGFVLGVSGVMGRFHGPQSYTANIPGFGRAHKQEMRRRFGHMITLFGVSDHQPHPDNRLTLSEQRDDAGQPKVVIHSNYHRADLEGLAAMQERLLQWAHACRPRRIADVFSSYSHPSVTHLAGTCIMGADPESSVTDHLGRVHGTPNLYIADASVFPGQGMGDSPSLTIHALALRTAIHVDKSLK
ncbi:MAG TPA: GMC family oxidoreductase [Kiritimatiellia bacterium]|nr:GMC family oxidoreductase [Kiritimatiellia bacterium]